MGYCTWAGMNEANQIYHDTEWGIPVHDDRQMFEHLTLECLQCGLSWDLMLKKREIFRECFSNFEYDRIAEFDDEDVERILNTEGMIRSPRKVQAVINNARCYQKLREEFGSFCEYIWRYSGEKRFFIRVMIKGRSRLATDYPTESVRISRSVVSNTWVLSRFILTCRPAASSATMIRNAPAFRKSLLCIPLYGNAGTRRCVDYESFDF